MKVVDFEAHYYSPKFLEFLSKRTDYPRYDPETFHIQFRESYFVKNRNILSKLAQSLDERIAVMDANNVDVQVLSISPGVELLGENDSIEMAKLTNDFVYEATKKYPGRFYGFASLPVHWTKAALYEFERCIKELGFVGWNTFCNYGPTSPDEEAYWPLWEMSERLGVPVYLHPTDPYYGRFFGLGAQLSASSLGFGVDTSITLMRLWLAGVLDDHPGIKIMLGHLGEAFPFTLERMDNRYRLDKGAPARNEHEPSYYFKNNIFVTSSGQHSLAAFACAKTVLGLDHIMFGSDYPYEDPDEVMEFRKALPLSDNEKELFYCGNAEKLFGRKF